MNLSLARDTVVRVKRSVAGQVGQLPTNTTIREAARFLRLHARTDMPEHLIDGIIDGVPITIGAGLADALRSLLLAAEGHAAADAPSVAELPDVPPGQDLSYIPNQIPTRVRRAHIVTSLGLLTYGGFGRLHGRPLHPVEAFIRDALSWLARMAGTRGDGLRCGQSAGGGYRSLRSARQRAQLPHFRQSLAGTGLGLPRPGDRAQSADKAPEMNLK